MMHTLVEWLDAQVQARPRAIAACFAEHSIDYQTLYTHALALAKDLRLAGVKPDSFVAIYFDRGINQLIAMIAILLADGAYVPLDPSQPQARIETILNEAQITIILTTHCYAHHINNFTGQCFFLDEKRTLDLPLEQQQSHVSQKNLAYVIYTSGSTGTPKGVLIEHESVIKYTQWFSQYANIHPLQRIDWSTPYIFDMAVTTSLSALLLGLTIVICNDDTKRDPHAYLQYLKQNKINIIKITPSYLQALLHELHLHPQSLPDLHTLILGGENLHTADCRAWLKLYPKHTLFNEYGPTEATVAVTVQAITIQNIAQLPEIAPIGQAGPGVECHILNKNGQRLGVNEIGELYLSGDCLARGYTDVSQTACKFLHLPEIASQRLYKTGDLCRLQADGTLECLGRIDHQVKIRGYRIELSEIETRLTNHPAIETAVVIARPNQRQELQICAYFIAKTLDASPGSAELHHYLAQYLPYYMLPTTFIALTALPLTANGKLDQNALPTPITERSLQIAMTPLQKKLAAIWARELGLNVVGIDESFYALGGHSLNAARIVSLINKTCRKNLSLKEFYQADTIAKLAQKLDKMPKAKVNHSKEPSYTAKHVPLSDFQLLLWLSKTFEPKAHKLNIVTRQRLRGPCNFEALQASFEAVLKRHDLLTYRISTLLPAQWPYKRTAFNLHEKNLCGMASSYVEELLMQSLTQLINKQTWSLNEPLLYAKIFYLRPDCIELQICLAHAVADEVSMQIVLADLAYYYESFAAKQSIPLRPSPAFTTYINHEQELLQTQFQHDLAFWQNYLADAGLYTFPKHYVVANMAEADLPYSTYYALPSNFMPHLDTLRQRLNVGIEEILAAAVSLALCRAGYACSEETRPMILNLVKSTRDDPTYDETIGCFIRVDPIKIKLNRTNTLANLAHQVQQSLTKNAPYFRASTLLKLACVAALGCSQGRLKRWFMQIATTIGKKLLHHINLDYPPLTVLDKLTTFKREEYFIIYMNVWHNFLGNNGKNLKFAHLTNEPVPFHQTDISQFNYVCDISFLQDEYTGTPYVVISANLQPAVRERIGQEIAQALHVEAAKLSNQPELV